MGDLIPYEVFQEHQRRKKYGDRGQHLTDMNFPKDYNPFPPDFFSGLGPAMTGDLVPGDDDADI